MNVIYKYHLEVTDWQTINLPQGAIPLSVGVQVVANPRGAEHNVALWAQHVISTTPTELREIRFVGTGHPFQDTNDHTFLGTVQECGFVWHIFIKDLE